MARSLSCSCDSFVVVLHTAERNPHATTLDPLSLHMIDASLPVEQYACPISGGIVLSVRPDDSQI
ncbi:hypothetical protein WM40_07675 [Robbsia andropogonis]|uniref:Uncharacterized protein n=1 Tax=Robbsia andropogonis TaxID=28092 RepID=A0A0F5K1H9_9BURK|nr:hypothetical protein WM40_07675 [Robbsia andropogonis]